MSLLMLSFNLLADGLREALDPKMKSMYEAHNMPDTKKRTGLVGARP